MSIGANRTVRTADWGGGFLGPLISISQRYDDDMYIVSRHDRMALTASFEYTRLTDATRMWLRMQRSYLNELDSPNRKEGTT